MKESSEECGVEGRKVTYDGESWQTPPGPRNQGQLPQHEAMLMA